MKTIKASHLTHTLENIAIEYTSANLSSLEYYIRLRKCICVRNQLGDSMKWMPLNYILHIAAEFHISLSIHLKRAGELGEIMHKYPTFTTHFYYFLGIKQ